MYCYHAYHSVSVENNSYRVCCYADRSGISVNDASIYDFFNSDYMKEMRSTMERGEWPSACSKCKRFEDQGLPSLRSTAFDTHGEGNLNPELHYLDLQFSNKCNLGCRMCWSGQSSLIAEEEGIYIDYQWNKSIIADFEKIKTIRRLYITGGETLLVKHNYKFLKKVIDLGLANKITLIMNSNCSVFTESFIDLIKEFKQVFVNLSIDGVGKVQEYIRWPSKWEEIEINFKKWMALEKEFPRIKVWANPTIQLLNAPYMDEYINYFSGIGARITINVLDGPDFFNLSNAPDSVWELIDKQKLNNDVIRHAIEQKRANRNSSNLLSKARNYLQNQDKLRKINIEDYEPYFGFLKHAKI
jgi:sulfatase maturation enzyme AslB (radical SAM superfamily)